MFTVSDYMSDAFNKVRLANLKTPDHFSLINHYKRSLYPPMYATMNEKDKAELQCDFDEVGNRKSLSLY